MKKTKVYSDYLIGIMIVLLFIMFLEFLATSDIYNEYVSRAIIKDFAPASVNALPSYSANTSEWKVVNFSVVSRLILIITSLVLSVKISRRNREMEPEV